MSGTNNFAKKYFLSTNWDNTNFHHFYKVHAVDIPSKIQFFQKLRKHCGETLPLMSGTNNFVKKYFLSIFQKSRDNTNFHHFCKVRACWYSFKNSIFQKLRNIVEKHFLWWVEQIILPKNIFLAQIEIIQIFTIFVRSAPVDIPSKIQFSKNCVTLWRNTFFDEWNK